MTGGLPCMLGFIQLRSNAIEKIRVQCTAAMQARNINTRVMETFASFVLFISRIVFMVVSCVLFV